MLVWLVDRLHHAQDKYIMPNQNTESDSKTLLTRTFSFNTPSQLPIKTLHKVTSILLYTRKDL